STRFRIWRASSARKPTSSWNESGSDGPRVRRSLGITGRAKASGGRSCSQLRTIRNPFGGGHLNAVAAFPLGLVQREVGGAQQRFEIRSLRFGGGGHTQADGQGNGAAVVHLDGRLADRRPQSFRLL